jgi:hypothetical protein
MKHWTETERRYLRMNFSNVPISVICENLNRSEQAVNRQAAKMNLSFKKEVENNLLMIALTKRFVRPEWFMPDKYFFRLTGINQKRWWKLYRGEDCCTEMELAVIFEALSIDHSLFFELRQKTIPFPKNDE